MSLNKKNKINLPLTIEEIIEEIDFIENEDHDMDIISHRFKGYMILNEKSIKIRKILEYLQNEILEMEMDHLENKKINQKRYLTLKILQYNYLDFFQENEKEKKESII